MAEDWKKWMEKEKIESLYETWDFAQFGIFCKFCGSKDVEINGEGELSSGWYGAPEHDGTILIKCHNCGKAMRIDFSGDWEIESENKDKIINNKENKQ